MGKNKIAVIAFALLSGCNTSPYTAAGMPDDPSIEYHMLDESTAEMVLPADGAEFCPLTRDSILLKAAWITLKNNFDHFKVSDELALKALNRRKVRNIDVKLCRGACPGMYSADALSHILVNKFSGATWPSGGNVYATKEECPARLKTMQNYIIDIAPQ